MQLSKLRYCVFVVKNILVDDYNFSLIAIPVELIYRSRYFVQDYFTENVVFYNKYKGSMDKLFISYLQERYLKFFDYMWIYT